MDYDNVSLLADELELDLISSFEGLGRFALSAPPSPALPSAALASPEPTPVQGTRRLVVYMNGLEGYLLKAAPPPLDKASSSTNSIWTDVDKENMAKATTRPSCLLFGSSSESCCNATAVSSVRSAKHKPSSLPREAFSSRPASRNHSPHPSSPLSPRYNHR